MLFFGLNTWVLVAVLAGVLLVATVVGLVVGRKTAARSEHLSEPFGVLQSALVGFMGLVLACGRRRSPSRCGRRRWP